MESGARRVTLLDGDIVRKHLSSELGFSREHRDLNILRIGFVASEITKNGGIAICAPIAPYTATRRQVRDLIEPNGGFIEIYVSTPLEVCEQRDRKGLYKKARAGEIKEFTGISDPYEEPENPDLTIDTSQIQPDKAVQQILLKLEHLGYLTGESE
jgi:sulfate adenylyltransferase